MNQYYPKGKEVAVNGKDGANYISGPGFSRRVKDASDEKISGTGSQQNQKAVRTRFLRKENEEAIDSQEKRGNDADAMIK